MPLKAFIRDDEGATAVEYGLIATLFVLGSIFGLDAVGTALQEMLEAVSAAMAFVLPG